jgi:hypothetical protein
MKRSMARQAEADRERRARIINADAELQASRKLAEAAQQMADTPAALQLRLLQTVTAVATEKNSTLVLPFPVELLRFLEKAHQPAPEPGRPQPPRPLDESASAPAPAAVPPAPDGAAPDLAPAPAGSPDTASAGSPGPAPAGSPDTVPDGSGLPVEADGADPGPPADPVSVTPVRAAADAVSHASQEDWPRA